MLLKKILRASIKLSTKGLKTGDHLTRYYMYKHLASVFDTFNKDSCHKRVLSISSSIKLCSLLNIENAEITEANFPEYNILNLPFPDNYFDYVVGDQVLEHVEGNPQQAIDETHRVLKPGGIAVHTTCFLNKIHRCPKDFWRFTPDALVLLCGKFSKIIDVGSWGNDYALFMIWLGLGPCPIPDARWHPLHKIAIYNDEFLPIHTWIVVKK